MNKRMGRGGVGRSQEDGEGRGRDGGEIKRDEGCAVRGGPPVHTHVESNLIGKWKEKGGEGRDEVVSGGG